MPIKDEASHGIFFTCVDVAKATVREGAKQSISAWRFLTVGLVAVLRVQIDDVLREPPAKFQETTEFRAREVGHEESLAADLEGRVAQGEEFVPPPMTSPRRFRLGRFEEQEVCFIVRDKNGQALAYVYFEEERGRRAAAHLLTPDEARRIAANSPSCRSCCAGVTSGE